MRETHAITVEKVLPCPPEPIWQALTTSELIARWLMPNDFTAVVGHRFNFRTRPMGTWDGVVYCEVLACEPPHLLRYSWKGGSDSDPEKGSRPGAHSHDAFPRREGCVAKATCPSRLPRRRLFRQNNSS